MVTSAALPYYSEDNSWTYDSAASSNIPIFDTTPFKDAPDEATSLRRQYYKPTTVQSYQLTGRHGIRPIYYPLPSVAGAHKHAQTVVILFHGEEEVDISLS